MHNSHFPLKKLCGIALFILARLPFLFMRNNAIFQSEKNRQRNKLSNVIFSDVSQQTYPLWECYWLYFGIIQTPPPLPIYHLCSLKTFQNFIFYRLRAHNRTRLRSHMECQSKWSDENPINEDKQYFSRSSKRLTI